MPFATAKLTEFEIRKIEIISKQYSHPALKIWFFFCIFLVAYAYGLDSNTRYVYQIAAANSYSTHSLYATVNVIKAVVAAAGQFAFARLSDCFGRLQLFVVAMLFYIVGTIIQSQAYDIQRFAGGSVLYQIGYTGVVLLLQVIISDNSTLNWRLLATFVASLPFIINTWISGNVTEAIGERWSWGIGMWAFIFPLACLPFLGCMVHQEWLARKSPEWADLKDDTAKHQKVSYWAYVVDLFWKLDAIGIIFVVLVLGLILVPFTIAGGVQAQWKTAKVIVPLVIGVVLIPFFIAWETWGARNALVPGHLMKDRGVWGAIIIGFFIDLVWYMPNDFIYTVLMVAVNELVKLATRITSLYSFVSVITGTILGFMVGYMRRLKPFIIFGTAMWFVANGLLVYYRSGLEAHAGIIGALCLYGFAAGLFTYPTLALMQACVRHENMAVITAVYLSSFNVGSAVGATISGAVWTQLLYNMLLEELGDVEMATEAYSSPLTFIVEHPWGTTVRMNMVTAYNSIQRILCIIGLCFVVPMFLASFVLRDHRLKSVQSLEDAESGKSEEKNRSCNTNH